MSNLRVSEISELLADAYVRAIRDQMSGSTVFSRHLAAQKAAVERVRQHVIDRRGITEVDIRSIVQCYAIDAWEVRLWNRRRLIIGSIDVEVDA